VNRSLVRLQTENQELESRIAQITSLYHVTKATARALRIEELFASSLDIVPRLLDVQGVRLIDLSRSSDEPLVLRARRVPDGRLLAEHTNHLLPLERVVIQQAVQSGRAASAEAVEETAWEWPTGLSRVAWAPLWGERKPIGVLVADDLPKEQLGTLSIVANQLSLQLARVHFYQAVETMAITDMLTGLFVRRYFMELAKEELRRSAHHGLPCTFVMVDLDFFKSKNDTYGHLVGDVVLRDVAQLMRKNLRGIDLIARYGGEEFIILLTETAAEQALPITQRLRQLVEQQPIRAYDEQLSQTVSMGLASFPEDGQELQELIDRTDQALYAAKRAGRNRVVRWSPRLKAQEAVQGSGHNPERSV
jgi:diguanylate cyclase (GGDEF)-like protein